jgi:aldose 1-epimerase
MTSEKESSDAALPAEAFGRTEDGRAATLHTLESRRLRVQVTDFGGRMVRIQTPDRHGQRGDVLLGFDSVAAYASAGGSFGALLGRNANRIAGASFDLDGRTYQLSRNDGDATLHGGAVGFDKVFWTVTEVEGGAKPRLVLNHTSADGDQGFPGAVRVQATYRLDDDSLWLEFTARTDKPTILSLSAHPYFNLAGAGTGDILNHEVAIAADTFLFTNNKQIPTGEIAPVAGTPFDFRSPATLGSRIREAHPQLFYGLGYDHCFVLGTEGGEPVRLAARVSDPASGRVLEVHTDQPGLQLYTGNKLNGRFAGRGGVIYRQSAGFALEPQGFPDAPHHPRFPSTVLRPGEIYRRVIRYHFPPV